MRRLGREEHQKRMVEIGREYQDNGMRIMQNKEELKIGSLLKISEVSLPSALVEEVTHLSALDPNEVIITPITTVPIQLVSLACSRIPSSITATSIISPFPVKVISSPLDKGIASLQIASSLKLPSDFKRNR